LKQKKYQIIYADPPRAYLRKDTTEKIINFKVNGKRSKNPAPYPSAFVFWRAK